MTPNITPLPPGGINPFDVDRFPQELIPIVTGFFDGPVTQLSFERAYKRFYQPSTKLYEAARTLVRYTAHRHQLRIEAMCFLPGGPAPTGENPIEKEDADRMRAFYALFKARVNELHIPPICKKMWWAVVQVNADLIPSICKLEEFKGIKELEPRTYVLKSRFKKCAAEDAICSYAKSDIHAINPFTIQKPIDFIFSLRESPTKLIPEILKQHTKEEIEAARQNYLPLEANASRRKATEERIKQELIQERAELKKDMARLRGPTGFDGAIDAAYRHLKQTEAAVEKDLSKYIAEHQKLQSAELADEMKQDLPSIGVLREVIGAQTDALLTHFTKLSIVKERARKAHLELVEDLDYIAIFDNTGRMVSGRWLDIERDMLPEAIAQAAREEFEKIASFYDTLLGMFSK